MVEPGYTPERVRKVHLSIWNSPRNPKYKLQAGPVVDGVVEWTVPKRHT